MSKLIIRTLTLTTGQIEPVHGVATFFMLVSNTGSSRIQISFDNDSFSEFPVGYEYQEKGDGHFSKVTFKNPNAGSVTIEYIVSTGIVKSSPTITSLLDILAAVLPANIILTPYPITSLDRSYLIDNAAAVDKGGGKVGIPVTIQPFTYTELILIDNTVNYDGTYAVDPTSSANEVVIVSAFVAETFDGVNDSIGLNPPRFIPADLTQKELILQNNGSVPIYFGDENINPVLFRGTILAADATIILTLTDDVYVMSVGAGKSGAKVSQNHLQRT